MAPSDQFQFTSHKLYILKNNETTYLFICVRYRFTNFSYALPESF